MFQTHSRVYPSAAICDLNFHDIIAFNTTLWKKKVVTLCKKINTSINRRKDHEIMIVAKGFFLNELDNVPENIQVQ